MLDKSVSAMISAIEIYNKPDFKYREETFSILCINSWELLLKAKVLQLSGNKLTSLFVWDKKELKSGLKSKKLYRKLNRAKNPMSVSLYEAYRIIDEDYGLKIDKAVKDNIEALTEIRDNSIHFINDDLQLSLKIQEIGTASLQNYLHIVGEWFGDVLSNYNFYLMPIAFFRNFDSAAGETLNANEKKLLKYIKMLEKNYDNEEISNFNLSLKIDLKFQKVKSNSKSGLPINVTNDPSAPVVRLSEEDMMEKYPWTYSVLSTRMKKRYSNFKSNAEYHAHRKKLSKDTRFCYLRAYNPTNPKSGGTQFFSPNILKEFDKLYEKS